AIGETKSSLSVSIDDTSKLTTSDYEVRYDDDKLTVRRLSDGKLVEPVGPDPAQYDGFSIESTGLQTGDRFLVMPTRTGAIAIGVQIKNPQELAFAAPVSAQKDLNNRGTG